MRFFLLTMSIGTLAWRQPRATCGGEDLRERLGKKRATKDARGEGYARGSVVPDFCTWRIRTATRPRSGSSTT